MSEYPEPKTVTFRLCDCGFIYPMDTDCPECRNERAEEELYKDYVYTREINRPY
jgi:hypothetical protein